MIASPPSTLLPPPHEALQCHKGTRTELSPSRCYKEEIERGLILT